jgi:hypothetical protein
MAYQLSGSKLTYSARTTVRKQHKCYFKARGNLRPARTIFYEQLIALLIIWKPLIWISYSLVILMKMFTRGKLQNALRYQTTC